MIINSVYTQPIVEKQSNFLGGLFSSSEKKYEDVCGLQPTNDDPSALKKYNECILAQKELSTKKTQETGKQVESLTEKGKSIFDTLTGKKQQTVDYTYSTEDAEGDKIMGIPKVAFISIIAIIVIIVGFLIWKKTQKI